VRHWTLYTDRHAHATAEEDDPRKTKPGRKPSRQAEAKIVCPQCKDWSNATVHKVEGLTGTGEKQGQREDNYHLSQARILERYFSPTNLKALKILYRAIEEERGINGELLTYAFSANLAKSSLLNTFRKNGRRWILNDLHGMSIPRRPLEFNVWMGFQNRCLDLIKAKKETNILIDNLRHKNPGLQLFTCSATRRSRLSRRGS
jgi:hypothetical protein